MDEGPHFTYHPTDEGLAAVVAIVNDGNGNVRDLLFDKLDACVGARDYTARADAAIPTTRTENRPVHPVRPDEPPFYETRYHYDNPDGLLTRIVHPDGSTVEKQFEIDLRPDPSPIERGDLRTVRHTPGPGRRRHAGVGAPLRVSARLRLHLRAGVRHPGYCSTRRRAVDRVRRPR